MSRSDVQYDSAETLQNAVESRRNKGFYAIIALAIGIFLLFIISLLVGPSTLSFESAVDALLGNGNWSSDYIVFRLRMPRAICVALVGAGLSVAGMAMQAMFRNPMASPSVLGLSSGASFGASIAIAFGFGGFLGAVATPAMAFVFCFVTIVLVYAIATTRMGTPVILLLLSGMAVSAMFSGLTSFIQYIVEPDVLQGVVYWTMGSFSKCLWDSVVVGAVTIISGTILICLCVKELNLISIGEDQAEALGVNVRRTRAMLLVGTALTVGGGVAIAGIIGFVGLIIPHICRAIAGPDHRLLTPLCITAGAVFMMVMDLAVKGITISGGELPIGILTSLLGAPFFIYIMRKRKDELWG